MTTIIIIYERKAPCGIQIYKRCLPQLVACPNRLNAQHNNTGQHLAFDSHHSTSAKKSVVHTLQHQADQISSPKKDKETEQNETLRQLRLNGYPQRFVKQHSRSQPHAQKQPPPVGTAVIPFVNGTSQAIARIITKYITTVQEPQLEMANLASPRRQEKDRRHKKSHLPT